MIYLTIPGIPPSANEAYSTVLKKKGGKIIPIRMLSSKAKKYKREAEAFLVRSYPIELRFFTPNEPYGILVQFLMKGVENKTFGKGKGGAQNRYKKIDVSNRLKVVEDVIASAAGVDDSQNMIEIIHKTQHHYEETRIWVWNIAQQGPFPDGIADTIQRM